MDDWIVPILGISGIAIAVVSQTKWWKDRMAAQEAQAWEQRVWLLRKETNNWQKPLVMRLYEKKDKRTHQRVEFDGEQLSKHGYRTTATSDHGNDLSMTYVKEGGDHENS
jgi:hypothetical protein